MRTDTNNLAPRLGVAWRPRPGTILRGGYGISYNSGSYATIARQMVAQPPFAVTDTQFGTAADPLRLQSAFDDAQRRHANTYGVDKNYELGLVQTWNADVSQDLRQVWNVGAGYTHTRGSSLDIVRAPNRGPDGLRIPDVQPFLWQTSEGSSVLNALAVRARRRPVRGLGGGVTYTLARSRDNASTMGGGGTVVAQNDQDLDAEWGLSSFDRRHQLAADMSFELPFGPNRRWLNGGGLGDAARELARVDDLHLAVGHAVHAARAGVGDRSRARHQRHAARRTTTARPCSSPTRRSICSSTRRRSPFRRPARSARPAAT